MQMIFHTDVDALFAYVEKGLDPSLNAERIIVGGDRLEFVFKID